MTPIANKIILLNAPKGAGKDTIGRCFKNLYGCELRSFKTSLYDCAYPLSRCSNRVEFIKYCTDRKLKERSDKRFYGLSPRKFLIQISEELVKPNFGVDFFGQKSADTITEEDFENGVVFTDSGFVSEARPLIEKFGGDNVFVVQFVGQGSEDFKGDSRDFIYLHEANTIRMSQKNNDIIPENFARLIAQEIIKYGKD